MGDWARGLVTCGTMAARLIGAHMPTSGGLHKAVVNGKAIGCTAIQVFTSSPQQWKAKDVTPDMAVAFKQACADTGIGTNVVSHDSYLINLAAPNDELREKSKAGLIGEMTRCHTYGIPLVVSHMGAHMGQGTDVGLRRVAEKTNEILAETPDDVTLLMETTAGQGTCLNSKFEELATVLELCGGHPRLGVCLDTCHIFAAGYDIRTPESYAQTMATFVSVVGLDRLRAVHCNDSKNPLGSRKDRHEHLGEGEIGAEAFRCLVNDARLADVPILVETPEAESQHEANVRRLWDWCEKV